MSLPRIVVPPAIDNAYWQAICAIVNGGGGSTHGWLEMWTWADAENPPAYAADFVGETLICRYALQQPCQESISGGVMTLAVVDKAMILENGVIAAARFVSGDGAPAAVMNVGFKVAGQPPQHFFEMTAVNVYAGSWLELTDRAFKSPV
jgi:hypothetical protein